MKEEIGKKIYRKLFYYFENQTKVHFTLVNGGFKNGLIIDLSESRLTLVLREEREGVLPFLLEEINIDSISPYRERNE